MNPDCVVCGKPVPDQAYACVAETEHARRQLLGDERDPDKPGIVELVEPARAIAHRQTAADGDAHSAPGPRDLLDYGAAQRLITVQISLTGWARQICEERGVRVDVGGDAIEIAAWFISENLEWLRHKSWVNLALTEIRDCLAAMRSIVAAPAGRVYLGVCGAPVFGTIAASDGQGSWEFEEVDTGTTCDGDVYGRPDRNAAYCQECGAAYDQAERRMQVAKLVDGKGFRASVIAHAHSIPVDTIRGWAWIRRDNDGNALNDPKLKPVGRDERGRPLYLVADVLALQRQAEQRRQKRAAQAAGMGA